MEPDKEIEIEENPVTRKEVEEIEEIMLENKKLIEENNHLLKRINRSNTWAFWLRILWFAVILGLPVIAYYYVIAPYYESLGTAFKFFGVELPDFPSSN
jgi:predicted transcriptional regulator